MQGKLNLLPSSKERTKAREYLKALLPALPFTHWAEMGHLCPHKYRWVILTHHKQPWWGREDRGAPGSYLHGKTLEIKAWSSLSPPDPTPFPACKAKSLILSATLAKHRAGQGKPPFTSSSN